MLVVTLVVGLVLAPTVAADDGPSRVAAEYLDAVDKGDLAKAKSLTARFPKLSADDLDRLTAKAAAGLKQSAIKLVPEQTKIAGDCAVVVGKQSKFDLDPIYLLRQDGRWRVLPTITRFDHKTIELSATQQADFPKLKTWFQAKKAENYKQQNDSKPQ